jgi:DNA replication protein DnaC
MSEPHFAQGQALDVDELGYVPLSQTGGELLFEVFSECYERGSTVVTWNLSFDEWGTVRCSIGSPITYLADERRQLQAQSEQAPLTSGQPGHAGG